MSNPTDLTDDFAAQFPTKESCMGLFAKLTALLGPPDGVREDDPRIVQIVRWCRENEPFNRGGVMDN